jgi:hypothetical protein
MFSNIYSKKVLVSDLNPELVDDNINKGVVYLINAGTLVPAGIGITQQSSGFVFP